jgi:hypothetical protein
MPRATTPKKGKSAATTTVTTEEGMVSTNGDQRNVTQDMNANREAIERRAWEIWKSEGCPEGRSEQHWLQAEAELTGTRNAPV